MYFEVVMLHAADNKVTHLPQTQSFDQGMNILTGMETRQLFRRMFVTLKKFKELFHLT